MQLLETNRPPGLTTEDDNDDEMRIGNTITYL